MCEVGRGDEAGIEMIRLVLVRVVTGSKVSDGGIVWHQLPVKNGSKIGLRRLC